MQIITLQPVANQSILVVLNNQNCQINIYSKDYGLFVDLLVNGVSIISGVIAENFRPMIINSYGSFVGDLMFYDNQGTNNPIFQGLGSRYSLVYLLPSDIPAGFFGPS